jgi:hypothetical protein
VAAGGRFAVVGSSSSDDEGHYAMAFVYGLNGTRHRLRATIADDSQLFHTRVAASDDLIVLLGVNYGWWGYSGLAHVFRFDGTDWGYRGPLGRLPDQNGFAEIATNGDFVMVGAPEAFGIHQYYSGEVYVFRSDGIWAQRQTLAASDSREGGYFGASVAMSGNVAVVGSEGSAYVFRLNGNNQWIEEQRLVASDGTVDDRFGYSVAVRDDVVLVGASRGGARGAAYVFRFRDGAWHEDDILRGPVDGPRMFGLSVAVGKDAFVVGGYGAAIVFDVATTTSPSANDVPEQAIFALGQNHPNPFTTTTTIPYALAEEADVTLEVFDLLGSQVRILRTGLKSPGAGEFTFDATGLAAGVYIYRLRVGDFVETRSMAVVR